MLIVPAFFATLEDAGDFRNYVYNISVLYLESFSIITEKGGLCRECCGKPYPGFSGQYDSIIPVYYSADFDYSIYKINRGNVHRRDSGSCTAYCSMLSIYGTYFPEQF